MHKLPATISCPDITLSCQRDPAGALKSFCEYDYGGDGTRVTLSSRTITNKILRTIIKEALYSSLETLPLDALAKLDTLQGQALGNVHLPESYNAYMESEDWHKRRKLIIDFYGNRCSVCFTISNLHVHHRDYDDFGDETAQTCTVLCLRCHAAVHPNGQLAVKWFQSVYPNLLSIIGVCVGHVYGADYIPVEIWQMYANTLFLADGLLTVDHIATKVPIPSDVEVDKALY